MKQTFEGTSTNGNIQEALDNAIFNAKETLHTDYVVWEMQKISGEDGGFVLVRNLTLTISASVHANAKPA